MDTVMTWVNQPRQPKRQAVKPETETELPPEPEIVDGEIVRLSGGYEVMLPRRAAEKLRTMQELSDARHALWRVASDKVRDVLRPEVQVADDWFKRIRATLRASITPDDDAQLRTATDRLKKAQDELDKQIAVEALRSTQFTAIRTPTSMAEKYLRKNLLARFTAVEPPEVALQKNETLVDAVARVRDELKSFQAELAVVRSTPFPAELVKQRIRDAVSSLARSGQPDVLGTIERGDPIRWPTGSINIAETFSRGTDGSVVMGNPARGSVPNSLGLLAWLFEDKLRDALHEQVDRLSDDKHALTPQERTQKEADLIAQILEAERREESFIEATELSGQPIARRESADPRAILHITGPAPRAH